MRPYSNAFVEILETIAKTPQYAIGDFLMEFFDSTPRKGHATGRSVRHGTMLSKFIKGTTTFGVGEVLQQLHGAAEELCRTQDRELFYTPENPEYHAFKSGCAALTSYAAQTVRRRLVGEQKTATSPDAGLHVFKPRKPGEEDVKLRLSWDSYGATTLADVQAVLEDHQPLTFKYISLLACPERHDGEKDEFRYRPPNIVCKVFQS